MYSCHTNRCYCVSASMQLQPHLVKLELECWTVAGDAGPAASFVVPVLEESEASRTWLLLLSLSDLFAAGHVYTSSRSSGSDSGACPLAAATAAVSSCCSSV